MRYYLTPRVCLKWLETRSAYHLQTDELYELDAESFDFLERCGSAEGCISDNTAFTVYCVEEGILTSVPSAVNRPPINRSPEPSLRYLELQITDACNLRCRHCYIGDRKTHELSADQVRTVLAEFEEMQGLRVLITGGEPLLHRDFRSINSMLGRYMLRKVLFSNGVLLTGAVLEGLNVDEIQISIDGLEHAHDRLRGKGSYRKAMDAVTLCLDKGFDVSVSTVVHAANLQDFDRLESMFREIGVRDWTVDIPCASGRLADNPEFRISPAEGGRYLRYGFGGGMHGGDGKFGCGLHLMSVLADGKIAKCTFYADRCVGTIGDGLRECWHRITPVRLADLACDCDHLDACRGGCRYRAELLGSATGKDLYRCFLYDIINPETGLV